MQDHEDIVAAARKVAQAVVRGEQELTPVKVDFDTTYTEDEVIEALAGAFVRAERVPLVKRTRDGFKLEPRP